MKRLIEQQLYEKKNEKAYRAATLWKKNDSQLLTPSQAPVFTFEEDTQYSRASSVCFFPALELDILAILSSRTLPGPKDEHNTQGFPLHAGPIGPAWRQSKFGITIF